MRNLLNSILCIFAFVVVLFVSCSKKFASTDSIVITGIVRASHPQGEPLENVQVSALVSNKIIKTKTRNDNPKTPINEKGTFTLKVPPLSEILISFSKKGFATKTKIIKTYIEKQNTIISPSQIFLETYIVRATASVDVFVFNLTGPVQNVDVYIRHEEYPEFASKTTETGVAHFENLPADSGFQIFIPPIDENFDGINDYSPYTSTLNLMESSEVVSNSSRVFIPLEPIGDTLEVIWANISKGILNSPDDILILFNQSIRDDNTLQVSLRKEGDMIATDIPEVQDGVFLKIRPKDPLDNRVSPSGALPEYRLSVDATSISGASSSFYFTFTVLGSHEVGKVSTIEFDTDAAGAEFSEYIVNPSVDIPIKFSLVPEASGYYVFARSNNPYRSDWQAVSSFILQPSSSEVRYEIPRGIFDLFLWTGAYNVEVAAVAVDLDGQLGPFPDVILTLRAEVGAMGSLFIKEVDCYGDVTISGIVYIEDEGFSPSSIQISKDEVVLWLNYTDSVHTVTSDLFDSGDIGPNEVVCFEFNEVGTYSYFDKYSPFEGEVIVQ